MLTNELANLKQGQGNVKIARYNPMKINLKLWKDLNLSEKTNTFKLKEYENTNYKSIQNKTMINLLLQKIKNLKIELNKRQETNNYSEKE